VCSSDLYFVLLYANPIQAGGRIAGIRCVVTDITKLKEAEREQKGLIAELKAALEELEGK
jgi:PAS domain-containing protein